MVRPTIQPCTWRLSTAPPSVFRPHLPYSSSRRPSFAASTMTPSLCSSFAPTRAVSSVSTASSQRSPLSTMRRASQPDVPVIPDRFLSLKRQSQLQRRPTLPDSWSPALTHAPLSADPAIRAFSVDPGSERLSLLGAAQHMETSPPLRVLEPDTGSSSEIFGKPPELPVRAKGHTATPSYSLRAIGAPSPAPSAPAPPPPLLLRDPKPSPQEVRASSIRTTTQYPPLVVSVSPRIQTRRTSATTTQQPTTTNYKRAGPRHEPQRPLPARYRDLTARSSRSTSSSNYSRVSSLKSSSQTSSKYS